MNGIKSPITNERNIETELQEIKRYMLEIMRHLDIPVKPVLKKPRTPLIKNAPLKRNKKNRIVLS